MPRQELVHSFKGGKREPKKCLGAHLGRKPRFYCVVSGWSQFISVQVRFMHIKARAVPVSGSGQHLWEQKACIPREKVIYFHSNLVIALAWHRSANWEIPGSAPGSAPGGALGNQGAVGGAPEGAQGNQGCSGECSWGCSSCWTPHIWHPQEHSLEHPWFPWAPSEAPPRAPRFSRAPPGALPGALPGISQLAPLCQARAKETQAIQAAPSLKPFAPQARILNKKQSPLKFSIVLESFGDQDDRTTWSLVRTRWVQHFVSRLYFGHLLPRLLRTWVCRVHNSQPEKEQAYHSGQT